MNQDSPLADSTPAKQRVRKGFTLVELLVVIMIIGIMMTLGIQFMPWLLAETAISAVGRELSSFIEEARDEAVISGRRVHIEYSLGDSPTSPQYFRSIKEPEPGKEKDAEDQEFMLTVREWREVPDDVRIQSLLLGEDNSITEGYYTVTVQPDGSITGHNLLLYCAELEVWGTVEVSGLLGSATYREGSYEKTFLKEDSF